MAGLPVAACSSEGDTQPPVAAPEFVAAKQRVPLGSPVEVTYRFKMLPDAPSLQKDYRVMVHFLDSEQELMWTDDHNPPKSTREWKAGETIEYKRTVFIPIYPYVGDATVSMGLYAPENNERVPLQGESTGQRAYRVATLQLAPQSENVFLIFKDGWHAAEVVPDNPRIEWQWTRKEATISFRNPKTPSTLYLHYDGRPDLFESPQEVTVLLGEQTVDTFVVSSRDEQIRQIPLTAEQLGAGDMLDLKIQVSQTFVPADTPQAKSSDRRELGIRVFHAYVEPKGRT